MIQIRDKKTNETYKGRSAESIARRVWGRKCTIRRSMTTVGEAMVVKPTQTPGQFNVLAHVAITGE